jgi:hypothetical protein
VSQAKDVVFVPGASAPKAREIQTTALLPEGTFLFNLAPASVASLCSQPGEFIVIQIPTTTEGFLGEVVPSNISG